MRFEIFLDLSINFGKRGELLYRGALGLAGPQLLVVILVVGGICGCAGYVVGSGCTGVGAALSFSGKRRLICLALLGVELRELFLFKSGKADLDMDLLRAKLLERSLDEVVKHLRLHTLLEHLPNALLVGLLAEPAQLGRPVDGEFLFCGEMCRQDVLDERLLFKG